MSRRFVLSMGTALLTGILVAAKEPVWMLIAAVTVLVATNYNQKYLLTQKIVRSVVLLAFFCLGAAFLCHSQQTFQRIQNIPEESRVVLCGQLYKKEKKGEQYVYYLKQVTIQDLGSVGKKVSGQYAENKTEKILGEKLILKSEKDTGRIGNILRTVSTMRWMDQASNEGAFDERKYYHSLGIATVLYGKADINIADDRTWPLQEQLYQLRNKIQRYYKEFLTEADAGILSAMVLGDKSWMEPELKELYTNAGISHILAVSGLHISVIGMGIYRFLRKLTFGLKCSGILSGTSVFLFCMLSGMSVSAVRAGIMFGMFLIAQMTGRKYDTFCALAVAGIVTLSGNPFLVWNAGFLFSYFAVIGAAGLGTVFTLEPRNFCEEQGRKETERYLPGYIKNYGKKIVQQLAGSCSVLLTTLPLTAYYYYQIPLYSIPVNLVVLPFTGVLLSSSTLAGILGAAELPFGWIFLLPGHWILSFIRIVCSTVYRLPLSGIWITGRPQRWVLGLYFMTILWIGCLVSKKRKKSSQKEKTEPIPDHPRKICCMAVENLVIRTLPESGLLGFAVIFLIIVFACPMSSEMRMDFLDVGQGDGIFLNDGSGTAFFVDGGSVSETSVGTYEILPFLKYHRVRKIDYWIISHGDEDHISGVKELLKAGYPISYLVLADTMPHDNAWAELVSLAEQSGTEVMDVHTGNYLQTDTMQLTFYAPGDMGHGQSVTETEITSAAKDRNERSLVTMVKGKGMQVLLSGDIGSEQEKWLAVQPGIADASVDIWKAAHHGSRFSNCEELLWKIKPEYTVISCGKKNRYGHPHAEALERINAVKSEIRETMEEGQITVKVIDGKIHLDSYKKISDSAKNLL